MKSDRYYRVTLCKNKKQKTLYIHRLIAETFLDNPNNLPEVNHIDENKHNNNINNLEWCSHEYNMKYGSHKDCLFQKNHKHYPRRQKHIKLTLQEIEEIKKLIEENKSKYDIAVLYNVSYGTIYRIGKVND
ncbi:MAG: HNH endonuclease [Bacilli bacterium]|nr:HNH endonuclease [Bacilli bacterium]